MAQQQHWELGVIIASVVYFLRIAKDLDAALSSACAGKTHQAGAQPEHKARH